MKIQFTYIDNSTINISFNKYKLIRYNSFINQSYFIFSNKFIISYIKRISNAFGETFSFSNKIIPFSDFLIRSVVKATLKYVDLAFRILVCAIKVLTFRS